MSEKRVLFYADATGRDPVSEEMEGLAPKEKAKVAVYIALLRRGGEDLRRPVADYVGEKLYELRPGAHRVLYFFFLKDNAVLLHLFRKKSNRMPDSERRVALRRMEDLIHRHEHGRVELKEAT